MKKVISLLLILFAFIITRADTIQVEIKQAPVAAFNVDSATDHWLNTLTPAQRAKSDAYFEGGYWLLLWNILYAILIAAAFLLTGLSRRMKTIAGRFKNANLQNFVYIVLYFLLAWLLMLPFSIYQDFVREHQYNLSNMSFSDWLIQDLTGLLVSVVLGSIVVVILYIAIRKTGKKWWLWGAGIGILFSVFGVFIAPVLLMPLFNKYEPLADSPLKQEILSMARANGIPATNVYRFDASKQSDRVSANVSGLGSTTRISLNDNLLNRCTPGEIKSVMGHEMGHYVLNHVYKGMLQIAVILVIGFGLVNFAFNKITARWGERIGVTDVADIGGLPLLVVLFTVLMFFLTPVTNTMTRTMEAEADIFGLNAAREPDGEAHVDMMLSEYRKIDPGYWEEVIFFDHPSGRNRVHMAMQWKAEHLNDTGK